MKAVNSVRIPNRNVNQTARIGPYAPTTLSVRTNEGGLVAVEFVIIFPVLLLLILGIVQFGRYYNATITITHAAREAVRTVALCPSVSCSALAQTAASTAASPLAGGVTVPVITNCPASGVGNASVTVQNSFSWDPLFSFSVPGLPSTISRSAVMRCGG